MSVRLVIDRHESDSARYYGGNDDDGLASHPKSVRYFTRWFVFGVCVVITAMGGTGNAFGLYSPVLKKNLNFKQSQLDLVSSIGNVGLYLGIVSGSIYGRYGVRVCVLVGAALTFIGYGTLWLVLSEHIIVSGQGALTLVAFMQWLGQLGSSFLQTATTSTSVRNFPVASRGQVVGLMKGIFGLSASVLSAFYVGLLDSNAVHYLLFIAIACPLIQSIGTIPLNILPPAMIPFSYDLDQHHKRLRKDAGSGGGSAGDDSGKQTSQSSDNPYHALNDSPRPTHSESDNETSVDEVLSAPGANIALTEVTVDSTFQFTGAISRRLPLAFALSYWGSPEQPGTKWWTNGMLALAFYLCGLAFLGEYVSLPQASRLVSVGVVIIGLAAFCFLPLRHGPIRIDGPMEKDEAKPTAIPANEAQLIRPTPITVHPSAQLNSDRSFSSGVSHTDAPASPSSSSSSPLPSSLPVRSDLTLTQAVRSTNFWLLFLSVFLAGGVGLVVINNIAQITMSLKPDHPTAAAHVTLIGFGNFFGRVMSGTLSDGWPHILSRPGFCSSASLVSGLTFFAMFLGADSYAMTYMLAILIGLTYGAWFCLAPTVAADLYGTTHHGRSTEPESDENRAPLILTCFCFLCVAGAVYGAMALGPTVGSIFFSTFIVNLFYRATSDATTSETCLGADCFRYTYLICAMASFLAAALAAIVARRARPTYQRLIEQQRTQARIQAKATRVRTRRVVHPSQN